MLLQACPGHRCQLAPQRLPDPTEVLVPHPVEQRLRDQILALHAAGSGAHRVARVLNEHGEKNPRTGGQWSKGTVASILRTAKRLGSQTPPPYDAYP